ncbi:DUF2975 domain-containing protein [Clostridium sp. Marseille-Q2269]|uniref:DUF2975 domain-containing protein n=1 Tax=Clostridium sp. Marseille-Q2269 TaxID=2942205 RepID=UPI0020739577|nr:DUF2975 domain-containing protein [Clostridium sp. Marseille-Q2269]
MKNTVSSKLLNGFVVVGIILTILVLVGTPLGLTAVFKVSNIKVVNENMPWILTMFIYICAVPYVLALFKLKSICGLLGDENPFSLKISEEFKVIAICAFSEVILFIVSQLILCFVYDFYLYVLTILPIIIVSFISIIAGFLSIVMSNIFKKAAEIKEELDLTF